MNLGRIADLLSLWMDLVAAAIVALIGRFRSTPRAQLIEGDAETFSLRIQGPDAKAGTKTGAKAAPPLPPVRLLNGGTPVPLPPAVTTLLRGSHVELVLRNDQFLFRPLELPKRAGEFLAGIVRSQIDRLTPWNPADAAFGWTPPADAANDRISLTVVATARARVMPYLQALTDLGAHSITVATLPAAGAAPITVFEHGSRSAIGITRIRSLLLGVLAAASLAAGLAVTTAQFLGDALETQEQDLARRIAQRRAALINGRDGANGATAAQQALARRKRETGASVIVLDALSQVLPDHTYLTELRIEGDKLQIIGITQEAPALIPLLEGSPHFTRATFFAPTTHSPGETGERFSIETHIKPVFR